MLTTTPSCLDWNSLNKLYIWSTLVNLKLGFWSSSLILSVYLNCDFGSGFSMTLATTLGAVFHDLGCNFGSGFSCRLAVVFHNFGHVFSATLAATLGAVFLQPRPQLWAWFFCASTVTFMQFNVILVVTLAATLGVVIPRPWRWLWVRFFHNLGCDYRHGFYMAHQPQGAVVERLTK